MPKAKKNVKLRDQKPVKDPKGGGHRHHHLKNKGGGTVKDDPSLGSGGLLP